MGRPTQEVADIFRTHGPAWRKQQAGHLSLGQLKVMSAIEKCRTAALGGHALRCNACDHEEISYNSCRNRHCPNFHAEGRSAPLMMKETTGVLSRRAEVAKIFDGIRPRKLTRPAAIHSYPGLLATV